MRVIHRESSHPGETVYDPALLVAIDRAKLEQAQGQFSIGALPRLVDEDVKRAVHGFEVVVDSLFHDRSGGVALLVNPDGRKHSLLVPGEVPRGFKEITLGDVRAVHELVSSFLMPDAGVILHRASDNPALGVEYGET